MRLFESGLARAASVGVFPVGAQHAVPGKRTWLLAHHPPRANRRSAFDCAVIPSEVSRVLPSARRMRARNAVEESLSDVTAAARGEDFHARAVILSEVSRVFGFARSAGTRSRRTSLRLIAQPHALCPANLLGYLPTIRPRANRRNAFDYAVIPSRVSRSFASAPRQAVIPSEVSRVLPSPRRKRARNAVDESLSDVTATASSTTASLMSLRRGTINRARQTYLATCPSSASRKQAPPVECGGLPPLFAARACPGGLLA